MKIPFKDSYLGQLRTLVGKRPILIPSFRMIIENTDQKVLFVKRSDNGLWGLPAGCPELGESIEDCIRREVFEETNLVVKSFDCFGFASNPQTESHTYPNGDQTQSFSLLVFAKEWAGKAQVNDDETTEVCFEDPTHFPPENLAVTHEYASIALYRRYQKTGQFQWS